MSQFVNMHKVELSNGVAPVVSLRQIFYGDVDANRIGAIVQMNGVPVALGGTCSGTAILADGSTVALTGTVSGNEAYVVLPAGCYSIEGQIQVFVKLTVSGVTTTLLAAVGTVRLTETDQIIDPGTIIQSVAALIADIDAAVASIPADYSALLATLAPTFSSSANYTAGQYVWNEGTLYRFTADHAAGAWTGTDAVAAVVGAEITDLKSALNENLLSKYEFIKPENWLDESSLTDGKLKANGTTESSETSCYTDFIAVDLLSEIKLYSMLTGAAAYRTNIACYDENKNILESSGSDSTGSSAYVISTKTNANKIKYVRITFAKGNLKNELEIVLDGIKPDAYSVYFAPYRILTEDFLTPESKDTLEKCEEKLPSLNQQTLNGFNLVPIGENGTGAYYAESGRIEYKSSYTTYRYTIIPVKKNTLYSVNHKSSWYILTDDDNTILSSGTSIRKYFIETGNATKLYYTVSANAWNTGLIISEGITGTSRNVSKPPFVSDLNLLMMDSWYGMALPPFVVRFTKDLQEKFYYKNILSLEDNVISVAFNGKGTTDDTGIAINPSTNATSGSNGYYYEVYDSNLSLIQNKVNTSSVFYTFPDDVKNCSALIIGDSTVAYGTMGQKLIDAFADRSKTITLLGTLGSGDNKNEGRSGWSAADYRTNKQYNSVVNPFYNPTSEDFDFSYYMTNNSYESVDFVVVQLGINDLYNVSLDNAKATIETLVTNICAIIDSILDFNSNQKIILNLPTPCTSDSSVVSKVKQKMIRAKFIYYNMMIQVIVSKYANVRCSYCHLILDPASDISDNIHPNATGFNKMAFEVLNQINCWQYS